MSGDNNLYNKNFFQQTPQKPQGWDMSNGVAGTPFGAQPTTTGSNGLFSASQPATQFSSAFNRPSGITGNAFETGMRSGQAPASNIFGSSNTWSAPALQSNWPLNSKGSKGTPYTTTRHKEDTGVLADVLDITAMKDYSNKSIDEIRKEDYELSRKPTAGFATNTGFGALPAPAFGTASNFSGSSFPSAFGQAAPATPFGQATTATPFGQTTAATPFGQAAPATPFGQTTATPFGQTTATPFGQTTAPTSLGQSNASSSLFGQNAIAPRPFSQTSTIAPTMPFGQSSATPFGQGSSAFGQNNNTPFGQSSAGLNQNNTAAFGQSSATPFGQGSNAFGQSATTPFGQSATTPFGQSNATFGQNSTTPYGQSTATSGGQTAAPTMPFGQNASATSFGQSSSAFNPLGSAAPSSMFGKPAQPGMQSTILGAPKQENSTLVAQQPITQSVFGTAQQPSAAAFGSSFAAQPSAFQMPSDKTMLANPFGGAGTSFYRPMQQPGAYGSQGMLQQGSFVHTVQNVDFTDPYLVRGLQFDKTEAQKPSVKTVLPAPIFSTQKETPAVDFRPRPPKKTSNSMIYTIPNITAGAEDIKGLTVVFEGLGKIEYLVPVSVLSPDELRHKIRFHNENVEVADDPGTGLNKRARVYVEGIFPYSRVTNTFIKGRAETWPNKGIQERFIYQLNNDPTKAFVDYDVDTGVYVYEVNHF